MIIDRTSINNMNYYNNDNNTNDKNYIKDCDPLRGQQSRTNILSEEAFGPEAFASKSGVCQKAFGSGSTPAEWTALKLDLFDNATDAEISQGQRRLKMAMGILSAHNQEWQYFRASLQGPWRNIRRGLDMRDRDDREHYETIQQVRDEFMAEGFHPRFSKFYQRRQTRCGPTVAGLAIVMAEMPDPGHYVACVIYNTDTIYREMTNRNLSAAQRAAGIVSSTHTATAATRVRARDLFGAGARK